MNAAPLPGDPFKIAFAGNIIVDAVKELDYYPALGVLANIRSISQSVGGCVPNTAINLAKIDPTLSVSALGRVGNDDYGRYVIDRMGAFGIHTEGVRVSDSLPTAFTDVMSIPSGERTFFHARGANAAFCPEDVDLNTLDVQLLHTGYVMLLDGMDAPDPVYGTVLAGFLQAAQSKGIKTSIDAVSVSNADYAAKMIPAFKYCNYVIVNEIESSAVWGLPPRHADGTLHLTNLKETMQRMADCGVKDKVIVHSKEAGLCLDAATGRFTAVPALDVPRSLFKGSVGAGDAFCAGCLYGIIAGFSDEELLSFASAAAVCNLFAENAIDGMRPKAEILKLLNQYESVKT